MFHRKSLLKIYISRWDFTEKIKNVCKNHQVETLSNLNFINYLLYMYILITKS